MKINIANPATGAQKTVDIEDERKVRIFYDKRISQTVEADSLGDQFKGYVFKITGGFDKQGFPMMQGVLVPHRVRLLLREGHQCYRPKRDGERKRKSVRGCIVGPDLSVINVTIVKKGPEELPGLEGYVARRLGPKRASKLRKMFNLSKDDDVRKYVIRREVPGKDGKKPRSKAPKIQRLVTPRSLQRKRHEKAEKRDRILKNKTEAAEYAKLVAQRRHETLALSRKSKKSVHASVRQSEKSEKKPAEAKPKVEAKPKAEAKKVEAKPAAAKPAAAKGKGKGKGDKPAAAAAKPAAAKPAAAKPAAAKPAAAKPAEAKPAVAKPAAGKGKGKGEKPAAKPAEKK